jgi:potassium/hydrogen antiporter
LHSQELYGLVLALTVLLLVAVTAVRLANRTGLPSLLLYLGLGLAIGEAGLGLHFENALLTENLGLVALAIILAEGGLTTRWVSIRPVLSLAVVLSTLGVAVSVAVVALAAHALLGYDWRTAVMLGSVLASTDAAAVFSVLRGLRLPRSLGATLEAESGLNDAPVVILVTFVAGPSWSHGSYATLLPAIAVQLVIGALVGVAVGWLGQQFLGRVALPAAGLYPLATLALALLAFAAAGRLGGSGFLAVYLAALWLGNAALPHRRATLGFAEGVAWLAQIGLFVLLGLLASPSELPAAILPALGLGLVLLLVARPLAVVASASPFRRPWREQLFLSWAGLRGAVPIVLATIGVSAGLRSGRDVFAIIFVLVVVFTIVQAPTLPMLARWLGLADPAATREVEVESAPLAELKAELIHLTVPPRSRLTGVSVAELRLPHQAQVNLIVRNGASQVPGPDTVLAGHDRLLIVVAADGRRDVERRLRAVSRGGRLAYWAGEEGKET